jgi:hypothetical protein
LDHIQQKIDDEVRERFPDAGVTRVALMQYGDEPEIEPGELAVRVFLAAAGGQVQQEEALDAFSHAHRAAMKQFRDDLSARIPEARHLEFVTSDGLDAAGGKGRGPRIGLNQPGRSLEARVQARGDLTPVMARLAPVDLETLDALITAGIAGNRAEAVRWALARIRERPAYAQLRERAAEIERLKTEF